MRLLAAKEKTSPGLMYGKVLLLIRSWSSCRYTNGDINEMLPEDLGNKRNNTDFGEAKLVKSTHNGWEELEEENKKTCVDI